MPTPKQKHLTVNPSTAIPAAGTPLGSPGDLTAAQKRYPLSDHSHPDTFKGFVQADPTVTPPVVNWPWNPCSWIVQQDIDGNFLAVWHKSGAGASDWTQSLSTIDFDTGTPTVDGGSGSAGRATGKQVAEGRHQHPATPTTGLTNVEYLRRENSDIADTRGDGNSTRLMSPIRDPPATTDGADVGCAFQENGTAIFDFHTAPADPSLALWPSGALMAKIWAKVADALPGCTYRLYAGGTVPAPIQYALQADGTFASAPAGSSGFLSGTMASGDFSGGCGCTVFGVAPSPGIVSWPAGPCPVRLLIRFVPPVGYAQSALPVTIMIARCLETSPQGNTTAYYVEAPSCQTLPTDGSWTWFDLPFMATALPTGNASDVIGVFIEVTGSGDALGGTVEVGYGSANGTFLTTPFMAARPSLVPLTRESATGATVVDYSTAPFPGYVGTLTGEYQEFDIPLLAAACAGDATDRLRYSLAAYCDHALGGGAVLYVLCGGPNASELDTLFGMSDGGTGDHQKLSNRGYLPDLTKDCHPQASITQVRATIDASAIVDGLLTLPAGANIVRITGAPTIVGIDVRPFALTGHGRLTLYFVDGGHITNNGSPGDSNFAPMVAGNFGGLQPADYASMDFGIKGMVDLVLIDNTEWHPPSPPNTGTT
jgi:hypothetical protein